MRIRTKMFAGIAGMIGVTLAVLSVVFNNYSQDVLLSKTFETCRLIAENISSSARDELLLNEAYDASLNAIEPLRTSTIVGLREIYVVHRFGRVVVDLNGRELGRQLNEAELEPLSLLQELSFEEFVDDTTGANRFRYSNPIFIQPYGEDKIRVGTAIFEFDRAEIFRPLNTMRDVIIAVAAVLFLIALVTSYRVGRYFSKPIVELSEAADRIAAGELGTQLSPRNTKGKDELASLGRNFNQMSVKLLESEQLRLEQAVIKKEMEVARNIQMGLLPAGSGDAPYEFSCYMETADEVGGDYFDYIQVVQTKKKYWWFIIGDVSGHGLPAGLVMLMAQTALHSILDLKPDITPGKAVTTVNKTLVENIKRLNEKKYMTASFYRADAAGNVEFSGLHLDALVYRAKQKKVDTVTSEGMWLGVMDDIAHDTTQRKFKLAKGDVLLLYTDGITEAMNPAKKMYGEDKLAKCLAKSGHKSPAEIQGAILKDIGRYTEGAKQLDDISFAVIRRS